MTWRKWLIAAVSFAAAIGVSVYLVWKSGRQAGTLAMLPLSGHLFGVTALVLELIARSLKFQLTAKAMRIRLTFGPALRTCLAGDFAAGITPSRSAGEPARYLVLAETGMGGSNAVLLLFAELVLEMVSVLIIAILGVIIFRGAGGAVVGGLFAVVGAYTVLVVSIAAVGYVLARNNAKGPVPRWARMIGLHAGRWRAVQVGLRQMRTAVSSIRHAKVIDLIGAAITSLCHVALKLVVLPLLLFAFGVRLPLAPLVLWPMALIFGGNAVPAPGGGGLVEVAFKAALGDIIPPEFFAATLIWWRFYTFYALILLGALAAGGTVMSVLRKEEGAPVQTKARYERKLKRMREEKEGSER